MARIDKIKQALKGLEPEDKLNMWNEYCSENGDPDNQIYENDEEFFNLFYANDVFGAVQRAIYGEYNPMHDFVTFNGYANLESISSSEGLERYIDDNKLAEYIDGQNDISDYLEIEDEEANEVSEDRYYEMLEVLPPYYFNTLNGKKVSGGFAVSEANKHIKTPLGFRATYNGFYKVGEKYFEIGDVYFVYADENGEPNGEGAGSVEAKTLNPDAFAKGGGVRKDFFTGREYSMGRNWTNDHRHNNKSEDYEVPQADRKRQYGLGGGTDDNSCESNLRKFYQNIFDKMGTYYLSDYLLQEIGEQVPEEMSDADFVKLKKTYNNLLSQCSKNGIDAHEISQQEAIKWIENNDLDQFAKGGGVRKINDREYSTGRNWTNDHRHHNKSEDYEVPQADRKRQYGTGGGLKKATYIPNRDIDSLKTNYGQTIDGKNLLDGAYAKTKVKKPTMARTQFEDETYEYGTGGGVGNTPSSLKKRLDNVKNRYGVEISEKDAIDSYKSGEGASSVGYSWYNADSHRASTTIGDISIDYGRWLVGDKFGTGGTMDSSTFKKGGSTPKEPIAFSSSNLYFNGYAMDINGNSVVRVSFPSGRAFSIQTNGTLPKTNNAYGTIGFDESEINSYVKSYGSPAQKKKLKIYKK